MDDAAHLREFLHGRDIVCPGCGYNLRGLPGSACPECSQELVLTVRLAEPKLAAWIAGLIALGCSAGFSGLLFVYAAIRSILDGFITGSGEFFAVTLGPLALFLPLLVAWVRGRRRVQRWPTTVKVAVAAGLWLLTLVNLLVFTFFIS